MQPGQRRRDPGAAQSVAAKPVPTIEVLQKSMIPLGVTDSVISYVCMPCARTMIATGTTAEPATGLTPVEVVAVG